MCTTTWTAANARITNAVMRGDGSTWPITSQNGIAVSTTASTKPSP